MKKKIIIRGNVSLATLHNRRDLSKRHEKLEQFEKKKDKENA